MRWMCLPLLVLAVLAAPAEEDKGVLTIVSSLPRTGSANGLTTAITNGIRLAIQQAGGKAAGYTIRYLDWDDASPERGQWDPAVEKGNAERAAADPDVMVYIGTFNSGAAKIAMPLLNLAGVAMISPANTYTGLTKPGLGEANEPAVYRPSGRVSYFRVVPADDIQGQVGAQWAKDMGVKRVWVLHDRELYGKGLAEVFAREAAKAGLEVLATEGINPQDPNYASLVVKMRSAGAEMVYFGGTVETNGGQLAKDIAAAAPAMKLMVPDGCYTTAFIDAAGAAACENRVFFTFGGVPADQLTGKGRAFVDAYVAAYGVQPEGYAVYGYECALIALDAIARAGVKDRARIVAALAATRDFDGALGRWSFDANGDTSLTTMSGNTVRDGRFAFVTLLGGGHAAVAATPVATPPASAAPPASGPRDAGPAPASEPKRAIGVLPLLLAGVVVVVIVLVFVLKKPQE